MCWIIGRSFLREAKEAEEGKENQQKKKEGDDEDEEGEEEELILANDILEGEFTQVRGVGSSK